MAYNIAVLTPVAPDVKAALEALGDVIYLPDAGYEAARTDADVLFVNPNRMAYKIDEPLLMGRKYVVTASTGTNHIDLDAARDHNVTVISLTKELATLRQITSTAEHAFALTLALVRNIPRAFDAVKTNTWDYRPFVGRQLNQMTAAVIGYGRLGKMYYRYARAFCENAMYHDPHEDQYRSSVPLDYITDQADIVSLHVHLTAETRHMVNASLLEKMKKKPYLVNTSRGDIVDEEAVIDALRRGLISGYATDVLADELGGEIGKSPVVRAAQAGLNVVVTPHVGGATNEAMHIAYHAAVKLLKEKMEADNAV